MGKCDITPIELSLCIKSLGLGDGERRPKNSILVYRGNSGSHANIPTTPVSSATHSHPIPSYSIAVHSRCLACGRETIWPPSPQLGRFRAAQPITATKRMHAREKRTRPAPKSTGARLHTTRGGAIHQREGLPKDLHTAHILFFSFFFPPWSGYCVLLFAIAMHENRRPSSALSMVDVGRVSSVYTSRILGLPVPLAGIIRRHGKTYNSKG